MVGFVPDPTTVNDYIDINKVRGRSGVRGRLITKSSLKMSYLQMDADHHGNHVFIGKGSVCIEVMAQNLTEIHL